MTFKFVNEDNLCTSTASNHLIIPAEDASAFIRFLLFNFTVSFENVLCEFGTLTLQCSTDLCFNDIFCRCLIVLFR